MKKHYRLKKDTFIWKQGAILIEQPVHTSDKLGYYPEEDIWDATPVNKGEYISSRIVEHEDNTEWFERVYPDTMGGKFYRTKDQLLKKYDELFQGEK